MHLLISIPPIEPISDIVREIKANTSKWCNEQFQKTHRFEWQKGYGAFTVSYSQVESVRNYIKNQKEHHLTKTFEEEYTTFLQLHHISYKPQYLFEMEHTN